ncbi:hypothetical protein BN2127_JRS1_00272 [Bacillus cereus]|nr:hypothetical protein BN2127_JRS1_00272 [Bacillus cereus]
MKWLTMAGITVSLFLIILYEWPKMTQNQKKEKATFVILTMMGWLLAILLLFFPDVPGPTQIIEKLFKPLGTILEEK